MPAKVRVTLVLNSLHGGGAERVATHLMNRCDPAVVDLRMALLHGSGPFLADVDPTRVDVAPIPHDWNGFTGANCGFYRPDRILRSVALAPGEIARMVRAHRADVVMSFLKGVNILTGLALAGMGRSRPRWIVREGNNTDAVIHNELTNPLNRWLARTATRAAYRAADAFLANSHEMADGLRRRLRLDPARVRVIHNPIDLARVRRLAAEPLAEAPPRPFILTVGRLEHQKGHDVLLRAFAASAAAQDLDLVILGRGSLEAETRRLSAALGVADRVRFVGFVANPWAWMARARLFVLPSRWEGFPSVVAEALACGAPAVVTACDFGPSELVEGGRSGLVVPPDDVAALRAGIERLLTDEALAAGLAQAGRRRAEAFDVERMAGDYVELFLEQARAGARAPAPTLEPAPLPIPAE